MAAGRRAKVLATGGAVSVVTAVAVFVSSQATSGSAVLWVGDAGSCTRGAAAGYDDSKSCGTLQAAYTAAQDGDTVKIAAGTYGGQWITRATGKAVTFEAAGKVTLGATVVDADSITLRNVRVENREAINNFAGVIQLHSQVNQDAPQNLLFDNVEVDGLMNEGGQRPGIAGDGTDITFRGGSVGNIVNEKGALIAGTRVTFEGWYFHDVIVTDPLVHNECIYAIDVPQMVLRGNRFWNCPTMDAFFTYGSWWDPLGPPSTDVTIENNVFSHSRHENSIGFHVYSLYIAWTDIAPVTDPPDFNVGPDLHGWTVRNNTFEIPAFSGGIRTAHDSVWANNIGAWSCMPGMVYSHNVGEVCDPTDTRVTPAYSDATTVAGFKWSNPSGNDFRLRSNSPAIGAGTAAYAPDTDIRGVERGDPPDAGAYEYP